MDLDVIYLGDFARDGEALLRLVEEVRLNHRLGYVTGLAHLGQSDEPVIASIRELVDGGMAHAIDYFDLRAGKLLVLVDPSGLAVAEPRYPVRVTGARMLAVLEAPEPEARLEAIHRRLVQLLGEGLSWVGTAYDALSCLREAGLPTLGTIWESFGAISPTPERYRWERGSRPIVGTAVFDGLNHWPESASRCAQIWNDERYRVQVIGTPPRQVADKWQMLAPNMRQHLRFVSRLAAFLYYPDGRPDQLPLTAIGACLAADIPVLVAPHLAAAIGAGPDYVPADSVQEALAVMVAGGRVDSSARFDPLEVHRRRMRHWLGAPAAPAIARRRKRALLFASNGDGLGHVTRLMAIARKLPAEVTPVFATLSSGIGVIEDAGYRAEMILSHRYANLDPAVAYPWMAAELSEIVARQQPDVFVFDGGNPYAFMTQVIAARRGPAYLWLRRGMWQEEQDNAPVLAKERYFEAIIEPADLAAAADRGATAGRRDGVVLTDPIQLIDDAERLPRAVARQVLGLDPDRPAVLLQLGVGNARDVSGAAGQVVRELRRHEEVQIISLLPPISHLPVLLLDGVTQRSIYPVAPYLDAFDFAISAAGYNSFHELVGAGVPTIFAVTMRPELDDQMARARFAEATGAGFALSTRDLSGLPDMIDLLLRTPLGKRVARHRTRQNGAIAAAQLIAEFAR